MKIRALTSYLLFSALCAAARADSPDVNAPQETTVPTAQNVVRYAEINPKLPVFIPVHQRIATTISFPQPIGDPMGTGFIDSDTMSKLAADGKSAQIRGEYVITFTRGDPYFSVQPLKNAELLNLNIPYQGSTVVLYFYLADNPLGAAASVNFYEKGKRPPEAAESKKTEPNTSAPIASNANLRPETSIEDTSSVKKIHKMDTLPKSIFVPATEARIDGFLRKLKVVHATKIGPELDEIATVMNIKVAVSLAEEGGTDAIPRPVNDGGLYQLILLRAVRDPHIDAVGFVVLFRNTSKDELVFDLRSLAARCGAAIYQARAVEAPARLQPGEIKPGYFVIVGSGDERPGYLRADNDWTISATLVSPKIPEGQIVTAGGKS